jgi:CRISPR-associated protein Csx16
MTTFFVSRHPGAIAWADHQGLQVDRFTAHLDPAEIQPGDTVIGSLPVHLAAEVCKRGGRYLNLSLDLPAHARGRELAVEELEAFNARLEGFNVAPE